jgi:hypothetical protein
MGKLTWEGWQKTVDAAAQPANSIIYGANIRKTNQQATGSKDETDSTTETLKVNQSDDTLKANKRTAFKKK